MRQLKNTLLVIVLGALALPTVAAAAPPAILPIQGYLTNSSDVPLDGTYSVKFELFTLAAGGVSLYSTTIPALSVSDGYFSVYLGDAPQTALNLSKFRDEDIVWLEISVGAETMSPRLQVGSVAFAAAASYCGDSDMLGGQAPAAFQTRVTGTCTSAQKVLGINANGSAVCGSDVDTLYTSGAGLALAANQFSIAAGGVTSAHIADATIAAADLAANSVGTAAIAAAAVTTAKIADNAITAAQMGDNSIGTAEVINDSLGSLDIGPGAITTTELAANAVATGNIIDGTIATADLAANSVTLAQMADSSVGSVEITDNSIQAVDIALGAVGTDELSIPATAGSVNGTLVSGVNYIPAILNLIVPAGSTCLLWSYMRISADTTPGSSYIYNTYNNGSADTIFGTSSYYTASVFSNYHYAFAMGFTTGASGTVDFGCYTNAVSGSVGAAYNCRANVVCF